MKLNIKQQEQLKKQLDEHKHQRYITTIKLNDKNILENYVVFPKVMRPEKMTSLILAKWLTNNKEVYQDKDVLDMGCGSGIQGIVMGINGAKRIIFSDLSHSAIENTKENIVGFNLKDKSEVCEGDLFENIN